MKYAGNRCESKKGGERGEDESNCLHYLRNEFVIHDIKVIEGEKGLFIAMPSRKAADGEYRDIAHPINSGTREMIQTIILDKYESTLLENEEEALA